jgi:hypothetical protein
VLQLEDGVGVEQVVLAVAPPLVLPAPFQVRRGAGSRRERAVMPLQHFGGDDVDADAADARRRPGEIPIDERLVEPDGLEDLRPAIALQRRDPHLGHHLEDALVERLDVVPDRLLVRDADEEALLDHVVQRLEREIRVDHAGAVAHQQRAVMDLARVARFDDQRAARPRAFEHEMMMDARRREQARDRRAVPIDGPVRQDDDGVARLDRRAGLLLQLLQGALETAAAFARIEHHRQGDRLELRLVDVAQLRHLVVVDDRVLDGDLPAGFGPRIEQVSLGADRRPHRRHQFLADRVERRVGDLREQLLEIVVEQARPVRQDGERGVGAHRADRLLAVVGHRREQQAQVLVRVAERLLPLQHGLVGWQRQIGRRRQIFDVHQVFCEPLPVGMDRLEIALDLVVRDDAALLGVDQEDPPRVQPLLDQDVLGRDVEHADLGRHDDEVVLGDVVARRPQPVAVEDRADDPAVGEGDRRRAVPRLHQRRVVLVERLQLGPHALVAGPRLRDHHQDGVRQRPPGHYEEFEHVVEGRRIAAALADDRQDLLQIVAEQVRAQQTFPRAHPVDVAAQGVDLAVVRDIAVGVRQRPRRERVGAEALVDQRQRRLDVGIEQIGERARDLIGNQHPFVDQRLRRQARDVERVPPGQRQPIRFVLDALADDIQLPLEGRRPRACRPPLGRRVRRLVRSVRLQADRGGLARADEDLLDDRLRRERGLSDPGVGGRHDPPAEQLLPFFADDARDEVPQLLALRLEAREEDQPGAVLPGGGQRDAERCGDLAEKLVRRLDQDAGTVPGVRLAAAGAAVQQVDQDLQALFDDAVRAAALDVDDESHTTGVTLVARIVQAGGIGRALRHAQGRRDSGLVGHKTASSFERPASSSRLQPEAGSQSEQSLCLSPT